MKLFFCKMKYVKINKESIKSKNHHLFESPLSITNERLNVNLQNYLRSKYKKNEYLFWIMKRT